MFKILINTLIIMIITATMSMAKTRPINLDDLPGKADFVFEGMVREKSAHWDERGLMIYTDYSIEITEEIFGKLKSPMVLSVAGGTVDGYTISVTNSPKLEIGKKYILFSYENFKYSVPFVGHEQGVFNVVHDRVKNEEYIVDYFGYRMERNSDTKKYIRGALSEINENGELVATKIDSKKHTKTTLELKVFNTEGKMIPQDKLQVISPIVRASSLPVTRSEFIQFIQNRKNNKDAK